MNLEIGTEVEAQIHYAYGASPIWLDGYRIASYPYNMPQIVKLRKTRGMFAGESILMDINKVRAKF